MFSPADDTSGNTVHSVSSHIGGQILGSPDLYIHASKETLLSFRKQGFIFYDFNDLVIRQLLLKTSWPIRGMSLWTFLH